MFIVCHNKAYKDIIKRIHHGIFEMSTKINQGNSCQLSFLFNRFFAFWFFIIPNTLWNVFASSNNKTWLLKILNKKYI